MRKDDSYSSFNPEYSLYNKNIRLTARNANDLLSITNEKGNSLLYTSLAISGTCLGTCNINDSLVLFTTTEVVDNPNIDKIYLVKKTSSTTYSNTLLYSGTLKFSINNKIQTLPFYENEDIQKVYWIDGLNQPRVINIADTNIVTSGNDNQFDFIQELQLAENISVEKLYSGGLFKSGVIQYAFTYFNKNGAESNIFYITPINYISPLDRGGKVDEVIQNNFKITLSNLESNYTYVRIYSLYRTSEDTTPEVKVITDINIPTDGTIVYTDGGTSGSIVSSDILLYIGGEEVIPGCMSQKNNTLFFGNIKLVNKTATPPTLVTNGTAGVTATGVPTHASTFSWIHNTNNVLETDATEAKYPYRPFVNKIRHFKFDETYRLGIQGQYSNGKWSSPI
jgi:hypothetical protein